MNKKNLPIMVAVLVTSIFLTIMLYFMGNQIITNWEEMRTNNPYEAKIEKALTPDQVEKLRKMDLDNIREINTIEADRIPASYQGQVLAVEKYDRDFSEKFGKSVLLEGRMVKEEGEITLDQALVEKLDLKLGQEIEIDYGKRLLDGEEIEATSTWTEKEVFEKEFSKKYKLVGVTRTYLNDSMGIYSASSLIDQTSQKQIVFINFDKFEKSMESKAEIDQYLKEAGLEGELIINQSLKKFYGLDKAFLERNMAKLINILFILIVIISFVLLIQNIFNIWGIEKIRLLSMYKSIGSTDMQIMGILAREAIYLSILPTILGHFLGFFILKYAYAYIESQYLDLIRRVISFEFRPVLSLLILGLSFLTIILATIKPARNMSKIQIIDGLKGNINLQDQKKKAHKDIWKELKYNNRKIFKSQKYISTIGIYLIGCLVLVATFAKINDDFYKIDRPYNLTLHYNTTRDQIPEKLLEIRKKYGEEDSLISSSKYIYIPMEGVNFTEEFEEIGFKKGYENYYYPEEKMLEGVIYFYDDYNFQKLGGEKGQYILVNRVQENPEEKPDIKNTIKYLKDPKSLKYKFLEQGKVHQISISKELENPEDFKEFFRYYNLYLITSYDNYGPLLEDLAQEYEKEGLDSYRKSYKLEVNLPEEKLDKIAEEIRQEIQMSINYDESFKLVTGNERERAREKELKSVGLIGLLISLVLIIVNLVNSYSSNNLAFINRQQEIGILLSQGFEKDQLEKKLKKEYLLEQGKSLGLALILVLISGLVAGRLMRGMSFVTIAKYYDYKSLALVTLAILVSNYLIYIQAAKKLFKKSILEMIK